MEGQPKNIASSRLAQAICLSPCLKILVVENVSLTYLWLLLLEPHEPSEVHDDELPMIQQPVVPKVPDQYLPYPQLKLLSVLPSLWPRCGMILIYDRLNLIKIILHDKNLPYTLNTCKGSKWQLQQQLRTHISNHTWRRRVHRGMTGGTSEPTPRNKAIPSNLSQRVLSTEDQVSKHESMGTIIIQTATFHFLGPIGSWPYKAKCFQSFFKSPQQSFTVSTQF